MGKKLLNKKVIKQTVGDLKKALKGVDDDKEVVLAFYFKDEGVHHAYLGEILTNMKYDGVIKEKLADSSVVELASFHPNYCTYVERKNDT